MDTQIWLYLFTNLFVYLHLLLLKFITYFYGVEDRIEEW